MFKAVDITRSQVELVSLTNYIHGQFVELLIKHEIVDKIATCSELVEHKEDWEIYKYIGSPNEWFIPAHDSLNRSHLSLGSLPQSVFMGIVATFDSTIGDVVRAMLSIKPDRLQSGSKSISLKQLMKAQSIEHIINEVINDEIYLFSRGSHEDQAKYIQDNFHIEIISKWKRWPDFIEVFERRNLIAHGEKKFTQRYSDICKKANHKGSTELVGEDVQLNQNYLFQSIDILLEFSVLLVFMFWIKHITNETEQAFETVNTIIYKLIESKRYNVAIRIAEYAVSLEKISIKDATRRMIIINLASAHRNKDDHLACNKTLNMVDWTATADNYKICVAALRGEVSSVTLLMESTVRSNTVNLDSFKSWPVFDYVRSETEFIEKLSELFPEFSATDVSNGKTPSLKLLHGLSANQQSTH